jgi:signal transduction histidine kinase
MGEMIGNIAHQWRQPLSAISSVASGCKLQIELDMISKEEIKTSYNEIMSYVSHLTQTIEDFRNFFKEDKENIVFDVTQNVNKSLNLISATYSSNNIKVTETVGDGVLTSYGPQNELSQVLINIFNNAKDIFIEKEIKDRIVSVNVAKDDDNIIIEIKDNAGGIPGDIIEKVFDPYFTTKHQSQGTGIGLYMSKEIIHKSFKGELRASNEKFIVDDQEYFGACFTITLPKKI